METMYWETEKKETSDEEGRIGLWFRSVYDGRVIEFMIYWGHYVSWACMAFILHYYIPSLAKS